MNRSAYMTGLRKPLPKYRGGVILRLKKPCSGKVPEIQILEFKDGEWWVESTDKNVGYSRPGPTTVEELDEYYEPI